MSLFLAKYGDADHIKNILLNGDRRENIHMFHHSLHRMTKEHIDMAQNSEYEPVRSRAAEHPLADIDKAISDKDRNVRTAVVHNPNITHEHVLKLMYDTESASVREAGREHKHATEDDKIKQHAWILSGFKTYV